jgi:hypothetical protein
MPLPRDLTKIAGTNQAPGLMLGVDHSYLEKHWGKIAEGGPDVFTLVVHGHANGYRIERGPPHGPLIVGREDMAKLIRETGLWRDGMTLRMLVCEAGAPNRVDDSFALARDLRAGKLEAFTGEVQVERFGVRVNKPEWRGGGRLLKPGNWIKEALRYR